MSVNKSIELAPQVVASVAALLGRPPRGLREVAVSGPNGEPSVIRVASLVDEKPFPTLYWLIDPALCYRIDQAEAGGLIKQLQKQIDADTGLQESMQRDHHAYIDARASYMERAELDAIEQLGFSDVFASKGIGGIGDFTRIRCLHTWYAAHLVSANTVGRLLDHWWSVNDAGQQ